jgi:hypothetical protein
MYMHIRKFRTRESRRVVEKESTREPRADAARRKVPRAPIYSAAAEAGIGTMRPPAHTNQQLRTIDIYCCVCDHHAPRPKGLLDCARRTFHALKSLVRRARNERLELNWNGILILRQPAALIESIR